MTTHDDLLNELNQRRESRFNKAAVRRASRRSTPKAGAPRVRRPRHGDAVAAGDE